MIYCQNCGAENQQDARFCSKCGGPLQAAAPTVSPASAGAKSRGGMVLLVVGALIVLLLAGAGVAMYSLFGPMSEDEYADAAEDILSDLLEAQAEIDGSLYNLYYSVDALENDPDVPTTGDVVDEYQVSESRDVFDDAAETIVTGAVQLAELRAPKEYREEHEAFVAWADFLADDFLSQYEDLLLDAEDDMTYLEFSQSYDALMESLGYESDVWDDYYEATEELNID